MHVEPLHRFTRPARRRALVWACSAVWLIGLPSAWAAPTEPALREVSFLLGYIEGSGCEFLRNGVWYGSRAAQAHLRDKFRLAASQGSVDSAEQFIDNIATQSSMTGQPYMVRCNGGPTITSRQWLRDELARLRANP